MHSEKLGFAQFCETVNFQPAMTLAVVAEEEEEAFGGQTSAREPGLAEREASSSPKAPSAPEESAPDESSTIPAQPSSEAVAAQTAPAPSPSKSSVTFAGQGSPFGLAIFESLGSWLTSLGEAIGPLFHSPMDRLHAGEPQYVPKKSRRRASPTAPTADDTLDTHRSTTSTSSSYRRETSPGFSHVRTRKSVHAERLVKMRNREMHEEERRQSGERIAAELQRRERYLNHAKERRQDFFAKEKEKVAAMEAYKATKRQVGVDMRVSLRTAYDQVQEAEAARAAVVSAHTIAVRQAKEAETAARKELEKEANEKIAAEAKAERAQRREYAQATVRQQAQATRDFAAQVRYETRPEVRQESRDYFQDKRDRLGDAQIRKREDHREERARMERRRLSEATKIAEAHKSEREATRAQRERLFDIRWQDAQEMRVRRHYDEEQKQSATEHVDGYTRRRHDQCIHDRFTEAELHRGEQLEAHILQLQPSSPTSPTITNMKGGAPAVAAPKTLKAPKATKAAARPETKLSNVHMMVNLAQYV